MAWIPGSGSKPGLSQIHNTAGPSTQKEERKIEHIATLNLISGMRGGEGCSVHLPSSSDLTFLIFLVEFPEKIKVKKIP
jgi:hypothetical protein